MTSLVPQSQRVPGLLPPQRAPTPPPLAPCDRIPSREGCLSLQSCAEPHTGPSLLHHGESTWPAVEDRSLIQQPLCRGDIRASWELSVKGGLLGTCGGLGGCAGGHRGLGATAGSKIEVCGSEGRPGGFGVLCGAGVDEMGLGPCGDVRGDGWAWDTNNPSPTPDSGRCLP